jgi:hypothetical protein
MTHRKVQRIVNNWDYGGSCTLMSGVELEKFRYLNLVMQRAVKKIGEVN